MAHREREREREREKKIAIVISNTDEEGRDEGRYTDHTYSCCDG